MKFFVQILFLLAIFLAGLIATETRLLLFWPACLLLGVAAVLSAAFWKAKVPGNPSRLCLLSAFLFGAYMLARALVSPVTYLAREDWIPLLAALIAYGMMALRLVETGQRRWLLWTLLLLVAGNLLVGIIHYNGHPEFHLLPFLARSFTDKNRIGGFFNNPNHLGAFLEGALLFTLGWLCFARVGHAARFAAGFLILMAGLGIGLTVSRGAMLGTAAGLLALIALGLWLVRTMHPYQFGRVVAACFILMVLGGGTVWLANAAALKSRFGDKALEVSKEDVRPLFWNSAWLQNQENPAFGTGARTFLHKSRQYRHENLPSWIGEPEFAHSEYLQMLGDYGWTGLGLLVLVVACHFWNAMVYMKNYARRFRDEGGRLSGHALGFTVGAMVAMTALLLHGAGEFHFHIPIIAMLGAAWLGILANPGAETSSAAPSPALPFFVRLAVSMAGAVLIFAAVKYGRADMQVQQADQLAGGDPLALRQTHHLNLARNLDPSNFNVFQKLARTRYQLAGGARNPKLDVNQRARAVSDLQEAVRLYPENIYLLVQLGQALNLASRPAEAEEAFQKAMVLAPRYQNIRLAYGFFLNTQGRLVEAEELYLDSWLGKYNGQVLSPTTWSDLYLGMLRRARIDADPATE